MKNKLIMLSFILFLLLGSCSNHETEVKEKNTVEAVTEAKEFAKNPIVTMEIEDYGTIEIELYPEYAPLTVTNFVHLIESGFYDGNTFHRLVPGFVLQGGDPDGNGSGGPGYTIKGEFSVNDFEKNTLSHTKGIISMARRGDSYNSAGSQFFIVLDDAAKSSLDGMYAGFGKVTKGMDILKKIESTEEIENSYTGKLKENITIKKVTVEY